MRSAAVGLVCALAVGALPSFAAAQDEPVSPPIVSPAGETSPVLTPSENDALRVEAWLELHAHRAEGPRLLSAGLSLGLGLAIVPIEAFLISTSSGETTTVTIACLAIGLGVISTALGIFRLVWPSTPERRLARWRALRERGPTSSEDVARFEGEIRGELALVEEARWVGVALGAGLGAAGVVGAGLTAGLARSKLTQMIGYIASGAAALFGLLIALLPWIDTTAEDEWHELEQGRYPRVSSIVPWASPWGGGLAMNGSF